LSIVIREDLGLRMLVSVAASVLVAALIYLGNFSWWLDTQILDADEFVDVTVTALSQESSREAMGELIADRLVDEFPLLIILESNLTGLFAELLATPELEEVLASIATEIHYRIVTGTDDPIVVDLVDYREVILGPIEAVAPRLAALVPDDWFTSVEVLGEGSLPDLSRQARWVGSVKFLSILGALVVALLLLQFVKRRGLGFSLIGMAFLLAGVATAALVPGGEILALAQAENRSVEVIISNTYDLFTTHLKVSSLVFALIGVALVATGIARWAVTDADRPTGVTRQVA
jgi:hypothetical protein